MKRYDLSRLMRKAWSLYRRAIRKAASTFADALRTAWAWLKVQQANQAVAEAAANALGIEEEFHSWAGWQSLGRMVMHGERAAFAVEISDPSTRTGTRVRSYFTFDQTQHAPAM